MSAKFLENTSFTRRSALQLFGMGAAAAALAGCAPTQGATSPVTAAGLNGADPTNFKFASWSLTEATAAPALEEIIASYEKKQGLKISPTSFPYNEYINQLTLQIKGGQFTGAAHVDVAWLGSLAAMGKLQDVSSLAQGRGYTEAALAAAQFNGVQYALPWNIGAIGLISNSELLEKVGVPRDAFPSSIDGFEKTLKDLKALGGGLIPYAASTKAAQLKDVLIWMQTFGSPLVDGDTVTIGDDASVEAVTWYKSLYDQGLIAPDVDRFDARSLFAQGRAAIYDDAPIGRGSVTKESPDPAMGTKLNPVSRPVLKTGDNPRALVWGGAIAVVNGDGAPTAGDFAQFATSDLDTVLRDYAARGLPPATSAALESNAVASDVFASLFSERITATATTNPLWAFPAYSQIESEVANRVQAVLVGSATPADAMKAAGEAAQKLIG